MHDHSGNERDGNAEASRHLHIDPSAILNSEQATLHKDVLRLRNKLVAHAEFAECPVRLLDSRPDGMTLNGPYIEANGRQYDLRNYLERLDVTMFQRIADLFAVHCLNEMYKLKDQDAPTNNWRVFARTARNSQLSRWFKKMNEKEHEQTPQSSPDQSADRALLTFLLKVVGIMLAVLLAAALLIGSFVALAVRNAWTSGTLAD